MSVYPIKNETDYDHALAEIEVLFAAQPNTPESDRLEVLTTLVEAYEQKYYPVPPPDPIDALLYHLESRGLSHQDLEPYIGNRVRVEEVLNRQRTLTVAMIRRLHQGLGISAEILIQSYPLARSTPDARTSQSTYPTSTIAQK